MNAHGTSYAIDDLYDEAVRTRKVESWDGKQYPSLFEDEQVCDTILRFASVTNGELAYRSYKNMEEKTGLPLVQLAEMTADTSVVTEPAVAAKAAVLCPGPTTTLPGTDRDEVLLVREICDWLAAGLLSAMEHWVDA